MSEIAITVAGLSKRYQIGALQRPYRTLREALVELGSAPFRAFRRTWNGSPHQEEENTIWALRDVCLEVNAGEVVGIIGRNGAGKSTLLKVLSRITEPTDGYADIRGPVGSLLEVGTGFHGELTGRENIYLNGAILGMSKSDINRQFDSIVAFAEVEKFIDTPVKFYSSGMYLRLAFGVAAHLEPEILLVDEVLAVGDAAFQKKCIGKMGDVAKQGRTILFVSHNMGAVRSLCEKGIVLNHGKVHYTGSIGPSIEQYYKLLEDQSTETAGAQKKNFGFGPVRLASHESATILQSEPMTVTAPLYVGEEVAGITILCLLEDAQQRGVFHLRQDSSVLNPGKSWQGVYNITVKLPPLWLEPGMYGLYFKALLWGNMTRGRYVSDLFRLDVAGDSSGWGAVLSPQAQWSLVPAEEAVQAS